MEVSFTYNKMHRSQMYNSMNFYICIPIFDHIYMPLPTKYNDYSDLVLWINFVFQIRISGIIQYVLFYVCLLLFMEMFFLKFIHIVVYVSLEVCSF